MTEQATITRPQERTALLFFIREERDEAQRKPIPSIVGGGSAGYRRLNRVVLERLRTIAGEETDVVVVSPDPDSHLPSDRHLRQRDGSFGERITGAAADAFTLGYDNVLIVGNDCLDIAADDIVEARRALEEGASYVAAPTYDGGAFLVGLRSESDQQTFCALPWQDPSLFAALAALPGAATLGIIRDDVDRWVSSKGLRILRNLLRPLAQATPGTERLADRRSITGVRRKALTRSHLPAPPLS